MNKITIAFATDNNYVELLATAVISTLKNAKNDSFIDFKILHNNLTDENQRIIHSLTEPFENCDIEFINSNNFVKDFDLEKYMSIREDYHYVSLVTYYRFFLPRLFPNLEKILYLDIDIVVLEDLWEFFNTDLTNCIAGVIKDTGLSTFIKNNKYFFEKERAVDYLKNRLNKKTLDYFNAGIILFNLDKMRKDDTESKLWEFAQENSPLPYQDQDILNAVLENKVKYVDLKYNVSQDYDFKNPAILHFLGPKKPHNAGKKNNYFHYYWDYFKLTPYYTEQREKEYQKFSKNLFISIKIGRFYLFEIYNDDTCYRMKILNIKTRIKKH